MLEETMYIENVRKGSGTMYSSNIQCNNLTMNTTYVLAWMKLLLVGYAVFKVILFRVWVDNSENVLLSYKENILS